jgi:GT2 family glycosyltransferase
VPATPEVAVVMITMDRPERAEATVRRLLALPDRPRIVVVDQGTRPVRPDDAGGRVTVLRPGRNLGAAGRNLGVEATDAPVVAFSDDDSWWAPGSLRAASRTLARHPALGLLAATVVVEPGGGTDPFCRVLADSPLPGAGPGTPILGFMACAAVVRRRAFLDAGGFPDGMGVGGEEDRLALDLSTRGWELRYLPQLTAHHHPLPGDGRGQRRRREVRNALWTAWQRLPALLALQVSAAALRGEPDRRAAWRGLLDALAGAPRVLHERRVVSPAVARDRARLL